MRHQLTVCFGYSLLPCHRDIHYVDIAHGQTVHFNYLGGERFKDDISGDDDESEIASKGKAKKGEAANEKRETSRNA
ncbi:hypothetical protein RIF29_09597 [Crotalaria pallida]|uniref:Uncharacterized protein n=1 Tax=Crotalaria pallida TaxID=3830 RepID=A0AAN9FZM8_CROPI